MLARLHPYALKQPGCICIYLIFGYKLPGPDKYRGRSCLIPLLKNTNGSFNNHHYCYLFSTYHEKNRFDYESRSSIFHLLSLVSLFSAACLEPLLFIITRCSSSLIHRHYHQNDQQFFDLSFVNWCGSLYKSAQYQEGKGPRLVCTYIGHFDASTLVHCLEGVTVY